MKKLKLIEYDWFPDGCNVEHHKFNFKFNSTVLPIP